MYFLIYKNDLNTTKNRPIVFEDVVFKIGNPDLYLTVTIKPEDNLDLIDFQSEIEKVEGMILDIDPSTMYISINMKHPSDTEIIRIYSLLKRYI